MKSGTRESNLAKLIFSLCLGICLVCGTMGTVNAHRVNLFAWVEGDRVFVESKFSGGKRVAAGKITVTDPLGNVLLTGKTDQNGEFSFKIPQKSNLIIALQAGTGHRAEWTIEADEIDVSAVGEKPVQENKSNVKGVIIGMGFIFGLTAIVAYIRKRRKKNIDHENAKI